MKKLLATIGVLTLILVFLPLRAFAQTQLPLQNSDFSAIGIDGVPEGWFLESWYSENEDYEAYAEQGQAYIACYRENDVRLCQRVAVEPDSYYALQCEIKTKAISGGAGANISVEGSLATSLALTGTLEWQSVSLVGKTGPEQTELVLALRVGGYGQLSQGEAWFRNVSAFKLQDAPLDAADFSVAQTDVESDEEAQASGVPYVGAMVLACLLTAGLGLAVYARFIDKPHACSTPARWSLAAILLFAFLLRCVLSLLFFGHPTDINCFMAWGNALASGGPGNFYTSGMFADYPPGYLYVLWLTSSIANLLGIPYGVVGYAFITKLPSILADLLAAYLIYRICEKRVAQRAALMISCLVAFNPAMAFVSGAWGQIDQVLTLLLLGAIYLFMNRKLELSAMVYALAVLVKPQALMFGPLFAAAYILYSKDSDNTLKTLGRTAASVVLALGVMWLLSLPLRSTQPNGWLINRYLNTTTSYPYASIEAFNLFALFGGNWAPIDTAFLGLTYGKWGVGLICGSVAYTVVLYARSRRHEYALVLSAAFLLCALFTLGHYMHERYLFPVLMLLLVAFAQCRDRRLYVAFAWLSVSLLLNLFAAYVIVSNQQARGVEYQALTIIGSALNVGGFIYVAYAVSDILLYNRVTPSFRTLHRIHDEQAHVKPLPETPLDEASDKRRGRLYCWGLTAAYAVVALLNLGTLQAPETPWYGESGDQVVITLEDARNVAQIRIFGGLYEGKASFAADTGRVIAYEQLNDDMFRWISLDCGEGVSSFTLTVKSGRLWLNEIAFFDAEGNYIPASAPDAPALVDEPQEVPLTPSYLNGMYFDELYHARTAYEHLHGLSPYENSHPPLGKVFIMLGVAVFGMNAFGWRVVGVLFGIAMVPVMYDFARRLFKRSDYALISAGLFAFDFMHFAQTRIATIDVYAVFFILLMYNFIYRYYCLNFNRDGLKRTLLPLALSGLFFGLGAASKWICIYAGGGLAIIFFTSLFKRYGEYRAAKKNGFKGEYGAHIQAFPKNALLTLLWCCLFFILIPVAIYLASYLPYVLSVDKHGLKEIWGVQEFMFSYHSGLTATHPFQSAWWQWPLNLRPVWFYVHHNQTLSGYAGTISTFGNPAVWWLSTAGAVALGVKLTKKTIRFEPGMFVLLVAIGANFLPWVLVTRCTFIYHYFASLPFTILSAVYVLREMERQKPSRAKLKWIWLGLAVLLFALFYPVISGVECKTAYIRLLEWLPGWTFLGY